MTAGQQPGAGVVMVDGGDLSCDADNGDDVIIAIVPHQVRGGWRCHHFTPRQDLYQIINKHATTSYL